MGLVLKDSLPDTFRRLKNRTGGFRDLIVRDIFDNLDFEVNLLDETLAISNEIFLNSYSPNKPYLHLSAKSKGINRPTVVIDVRDAIVYSYCIEQLEDVLIEKTRANPSIHGGLKITKNLSPYGQDYYEKWFEDWNKHNKDLRKSIDKTKYVVSTDIASYFENINISVLRDMIMRDAKSSHRNVIDLLFYFIDQTKIRENYEANNNIGLLQENIDCSRSLAYYFLHSHDMRMASNCGSVASYYRYADDMSITLDSETNGRKMLKFFTESLRKLNLVAGIQKTSIFNKSQAYQEFLFIENDVLDSIQKAYFANAKNKDEINKLAQQLENLYIKFLFKKKDKHKNWEKVLKRFYTIAAYLGTPILVKDIESHLILYPNIFSEGKIINYVFSLKELPDFHIIVKKLIGYLYSPENLYPQIETNLIELLLLIPEPSLDDKNLKSLQSLGSNIFWRKGFSPQSDYARSLALLLIYKYEKSNLDKIRKHYINSDESDPILRKYMIAVSLTLVNKNIYSKVLSKAKNEQSHIINRLVRFVDLMGTHQENELVKSYIKSRNYGGDNVRGMILANLIAIHGDIK